MELKPAPTSIPTILTTILASYYVLNLSYPASYGQMLGFLQEALLQEPFHLKGKKCAKLLKRL